MVTNTNTYSESWNQIYNILVANTTDPTNKAKWIYSSEPDKVHETKSVYPLIVLKPIKANQSVPVVINRKIKIFPLRIIAEVYSTNNEQLDSMTNDVVDAIEASEDSLATSFLYNFVLTAVDPDEVSRGQTRIHQKIINWDFEYHAVRS